MDFFAEALRLARRAQDLDEVPVGAVVVHTPTNRIVGRGYNRTRLDQDPSAHAEIIALRRAAKKLGSARLPDCDLYVTLEPCPMCAQALSIARIRRVYFGAFDAKGGGVVHGARVFAASSCHHRPQVCGGIDADICGQMLQAFFQEKRRLKGRNRIDK